MPRPFDPDATPRGGNLGFLTVLGIALVVAIAAGRAPRVASAQPGGRAETGPHVYRQTLVVWSNMDRTLTEWESRGWETFQIVPVANPNPGTGAAMQVALVFRKAAADRGK